MVIDENGNRVNNSRISEKYYYGKDIQKIPKQF